MGAKPWTGLFIEIKSSKTNQIFKKHICNVNEESWFSYACHVSIILTLILFILIFCLLICF